MQGAALFVYRGFEDAPSEVPPLFVLLLYPVREAASSPLLLVAFPWAGFLSQSGIFPLRRRLQAQESQRSELKTKHILQRLLSRTWCKPIKCDWFRVRCWRYWGADPAHCEEAAAFSQNLDWGGRSGIDDDLTKDIINRTCHSIIDETVRSIKEAFPEEVPSEQTFGKLDFGKLCYIDIFSKEIWSNNIFLNDIQDEPLQDLLPSQPTFDLLFATFFFLIHILFHIQFV